MSKLLALLATLKAVLVLAAVTFATGGGLPVVLISLLFSLAEFGAKPVGQTVPRDVLSVSSKHDSAANFHAVAGSECTRPTPKTPSNPKTV
jgi:hypothetical protein